MEASLTFSLHKTNDDDVEFLPLALICREKMTEKPTIPHNGSSRKIIFEKIEKTTGSELK